MCGVRGSLFIVPGIGRSNRPFVVGEVRGVRSGRVNMIWKQQLGVLHVLSTLGYLSGANDPGPSLVHERKKQLLSRYLGCTWNQPLV